MALRLRGRRSGGYVVGRPTATIAAHGVRKRKKTNILNSEYDDHQSFAIDEEEWGSSTGFHKPLAFLNMLLVALVGVHYQGLGKSPLNTHKAIMLLFITAAIVYSITFAGIKMLPYNSNYHCIYRLICLISGILGCELLVLTLISPIWLLLINLCSFLFVVALHCWHQQIYKCLCHTPNLVFEIVYDLFQQIYQIAFQIVNILRDWFREIFQALCRDWLYPIFQTIRQAFNMCSSTQNTKEEQEDSSVQMADIV